MSVRRDFGGENENDVYTERCRVGLTSPSVPSPSLHYIHTSSYSLLQHRVDDVHRAPPSRLLLCGVPATSHTAAAAAATRRSRRSHSLCVLGLCIPCSCRPGARLPPGFSAIFSLYRRFRAGCHRLPFRLFNRAPLFLLLYEPLQWIQVLLQSGRRQSEYRFRRVSVTEKPLQRRQALLHLWTRNGRQGRKGGRGGGLGRGVAA